MDIKCTKCKETLAKIAGKALYLSGGTFISGQEFSIVLKCKCDEIVAINFENGKFEYEQPEESEESPEGGEDSESGEDTEGGEGGEEEPILPTKPKSWITGKVKS